MKMDFCSFDFLTPEFLYKVFRPGLSWETTADKHFWKGEARKLKSAIKNEYEELYNNMNTDLEKRLEYVRSQREILQRTEEKLQKQLDAEKLEFDFKTKMPVGSVWLGNLTVNSWEHKTITFVRQYNEEMPATIYHAHQIVKAAQHYIESQGDGWHDLNEAVEAAEQDGVLQNLE